MQESSPTAAEDRQLAWRLAAGDRAAFETVLDRYGARVQRLARRYAACESDAEDLTQEIFVDLFRCAGSFRGEAQLGTWIYRVALNHCLRHRRNQYREADRVQPADEAAAEPPDPHSDPTRRLARRELSQQVHAALETISPLHRDVIVLHELHGLTYQECARVLDVPVGTVKSRLSNAFRALRAALGPYVLGQTAEAAPETPLSPLLPPARPETAGGTS